MSHSKPSHSQRKNLADSMLPRRQCLAGLTAGAITGASSLDGIADDGGKSPPLITASSKSGVAATVHPLASEAAVASLRAGGNAVDAAAAASFMLSVVDGHNSGLGGGCFIMLRTADGKCLALDGRETAPRLATPDRFTSGGKPDPMSTRVGPKAVGTPGQVAALESLVQSHGRHSLAQAIQPALVIAESGFVVDGFAAKRIASVAGLLKNFAGSKAIYFKGNRPLRVGDRLRQPDLASTLGHLADTGSSWFYDGPFAEKVDAWMRSHNGLLRREDFADYKVLPRIPIRVDYRDHKVHLFPPPSSGGIHIAQALAILQRFDVASIYRQEPAAFYHLVLETLRLVMADRVRHLGDADFVDVPQGLLDQEYLRRRSADLSLDKRLRDVVPGQPVNTTPWPKSEVAMPATADKHTTHLTTADAEGNVVAMTQTINTTYGSKVVVPGTGVVLNNEMDDFAISAGIANAYGLMGGKANQIEPGKRPLSSMSPSIAVRESTGDLFACGAAGGPRILTTVLQLLVRHLDLGQTPGECLAAPRVHHQWRPKKSFVEASLPVDIQKSLEQRGHTLEVIQAASTAQALQRRNHQWSAASDPRVPSAARAVKG
ncbi:MAG: gamma-glutamyltransferase [Planctomycetota bacterium]